MSWDDVARTCRQICVLREQGRGADAERLQTDALPRLLEGLPPAEADPTGQRLNTIFTAETERVANANVLAELLVPRLSRTLLDALPMPAAGGTVVAARPAAPPPPRRPGSGNIADFIDEMIAQERPPARRAS